VVRQAAKVIERRFTDEENTINDEPMVKAINRQRTPKVEAQN